MEEHWKLSFGGTNFGNDSTFALESIHFNYIQFEILVFPSVTQADFWKKNFSFLGKSFEVPEKSRNVLHDCGFKISQLWCAGVKGYFGQPTGHQSLLHFHAFSTELSISDGKHPSSMPLSVPWCPPKRDVLLSFRLLLGVYKGPAGSPGNQKLLFLFNIYSISWNFHRMFNRHSLNELQCWPLTTGVSWPWWVPVNPPHLYHLTIKL